MPNIEVRKLTMEELNSLIKDAPETETRFIKKIDAPYLWMSIFAVEQSGLIIDGKPVYFGAIVRNPENFNLHFWTVVNKNVRHQFTLFKQTKKMLMEWLNKYKVIFATMYKDSEKNLNWVIRLGFIKIKEDSNTVTLMIGGIKCT